MCSCRLAPSSLVVAFILPFLKIVQLLIESAFDPTIIARIGEVVESDQATTMDGHDGPSHAD
jgi:hypothetical protein